MNLGPLDRTCPSTRFFLLYITVGGAGPAPRKMRRSSMIWRAARRAAPTVPIYTFKNLPANFHLARDSRPRPLCGSRGRDVARIFFHVQHPLFIHSSAPSVPGSSRLPASGRLPPPRLPFRSRIPVPRSSDSSWQSLLSGIIVRRSLFIVLEGTRSQRVP